MRRFLRCIGIFLVLCPVVVSPREQFERGDAIYRYGAFGFGHAGLYIDWNPAKYPADRTSHTIIDAITEGRDSVVIRNFRDFCQGGKFWSVRRWRHTFSAEVRRKISDRALEIAQDGARYNFFFGYKQPVGKDPTFRCDGLVEYCYETALGHPWWPGLNGGIVINDTWITMAPITQMLQLLREKDPILDTVSFVTPCQGDTVDGSVLVIAYMHDGIYGSGVSKAQLWANRDTFHMLEEVSPGDTWSTAEFKWNSGKLKNGCHVLNVRGFDQAGNSSTSSVTVFVNNQYPRITGTYPEAHQEDIPPDTTLWIEFNKRMDTTSVENAILFHPQAIFRTGWDDSSRLLLLEPELDLDYCSPYTITISDSARDQQGRRLDGDGDGEPGGEFRLSFRTGPPRLKVWAEPPVSHLNQNDSITHIVLVQNRSTDSLRGILCARGAQFGWEVQPANLRSTFILEPGSIHSDSIVIKNLHAVGPIEVELGVKLTRCQESADIYSWVAGDHIMDHPDETYDISDATYSHPWLVDTESQIGILLSGWSDGIGHMLGEFNIPTAVVKPDLSLLNAKGRNLSDLSVLLVGSAGLAGLSNSHHFEDRLDEYVYMGGTLIVLSQQNSVDFDCLPGPELKGKGWNQDQSCLWKAAYIEDWHPILSGQDKPLIDCSVDGYFPEWPENSILILRRTSTTMPCLLIYRHGDGNVLATSMFSDWGLGHSQTTRAEKRLIRDIVTWALSPNTDICAFAPGEQISLSSAFSNNSNRELADAKLHILSPDRETLAVREVRLSPPLAPGEQRAIQLDLPGQTSLGIYPISAQLYDSEGVCACDLSLFDRFLVREELDYGRHTPSAPRIWSTTETEFVTQGSQVIYDVHIANPGTDSLLGALLVGVHQNQGEWWAIIDSLTGICVPPDSSVTVQFTDTLSLSTSTYFGLYQTDHLPPSRFFTNATCCCQKGIWVGTPSCELITIAQPDSICAEDTLSITSLVVNHLPMRYEADITIRAIDPNGSPVWEDTLHVDVGPAHGAADSVQYVVPSRPIPGVHSVEATCLHRNHILAKSRAYFRIPAPNLTAHVHLPDTLGQSTPIEVCLLNMGTEPDSGGTIVADIEGPEGDTAWSEHVTFGMISPGESSFVYLWPAIDHPRFGTYKLLLAILHQGTPMVSAFHLESHLDLRLSLDPVLPVAGKPVIIRLEAENCGPFKIEATSQVSAEGWYLATDDIEVQPRSTQVVEFHALLPDTLSSGHHPIWLTVSCADTIRLKKQMFLGEPSLSFSYDFIDSSSSDTISLKVLNTGKTSCNPWVHASLLDRYSTEVAGLHQRLEARPDRGCTLLIAVPPATCTGDYLLEVSAVDSVTGVSKLWQRPIALAGTSCKLVATTGREIYPPEDTLDVHFALRNDSTDLAGLVVSTITDDCREIGFLFSDATNPDNVLEGCQLIQGGLEISPHFAWMETTFAFAEGPSMPSYVALDRRGLIYATDFFHNHIHVMDARGRPIGELGSTGSGKGEFGGIWGIALDESCNIYASDFLNSRIQKFSSYGEFTAEWSVPGTPWDLCVDDSGCVYVVDSQNSRICKYTSDGTHLTQWGSEGSRRGQFNDPWGIGTDGSLIFVADTYNHRIQVFSRTGDFLREWGKYGHGEGDLLYPSDVALDEYGFVYVGELGPYISKFTADGEFVSRFSPHGQYPPAWSVATGSGGVLVSSGYHYLLNRYSVGKKGSVVTKEVSLGDATRVLSFIARQRLNDGAISYEYSTGTDWQSTRILPSEDLAGKSISFKAVLERTSPAYPSPELSALGLMYETDFANPTLWDDSLQVALSPGTTFTATKKTKVEYSDGRLYLTSDLTNVLHQRVSSSLYPFFLSNENLLLTLSASSGAYLPSEDVPITIKTGNSSNQVMTGVTLEVRTGVQDLLVDTFDLQPSQWDTALVVASSESSFTVSATAMTPQGDSVTILEEVFVGPASASADIHTPQSVSHEPFEMSYRLTNTSPHSLDLGLQITLGDSVVDSLKGELPPYGILHGGQCLQTMQSETLNILIQGDLDTCVSKAVYFAERAEVEPRINKWFAPYAQKIPFDVLNTGFFDIGYTITANARDSLGQIASVGKTDGAVPKLGYQEATLPLDLPPGRYDLDYEFACSHGKILCRGNTSIGICEPYDVRIDSTTLCNEVPELCGFVSVVHYITNYGASAFAGDLSLATLFYQSSEGIFLEPAEVKSCTSVIPSTASEGYYDLVSTLTQLGQLHDSCLTQLRLAPFYELWAPETVFCEIGEMASCTVNVLNSGDAAGLASLKLVLPSVLEDSHSIYLDPCSTLTDSFTFLVPTDFETGRYAAVLKLDSLEEDIAILVSGHKIDVVAQFDRKYYAPSDTALLTLKTENLTDQALDLDVRLNTGDFQATDSLTLPGGETADILFHIPLFAAGDRVFYGFYLEGGRALHLNAVYIPRQKDTLSVYTEKDVYYSGDTVTTIVETEIPGMIISRVFGGRFPPDGMEVSPPGSTFTFLTPEEIATGTYRIEYAFSAKDDSSLVIHGRHPFDILGYTLRVLRSELDRRSYRKGDTLKAMHLVRSNRDLTGLLQGWIRDSKGEYATCYKEQIQVREGLNRLNCSGPILSGESGPAALVYGLFKPRPGNDYSLVLAAGMNCLDLEPLDTIPPEFIWLSAQPDTFNPLRNETMTVSLLLSESCSVCQVTITDEHEITAKAWSIRNVDETEQRLRWSGIGASAGEYIIRSWAYDLSGNASDTAYTELYVAADTVPPITTLEIGKPRFGSSPVFITDGSSLSLYARDDISGVAATEHKALFACSEDTSLWSTYSMPFTLEGSDGRLELFYRSLDRARNMEQPRTCALFVDNTPPENSLDFRGPHHIAEHIYLSPSTETVVLSKDSGSGCSEAAYGVDSGPFRPFMDSTRVYMEDEGRHEVTMVSVDHLGNLSEDKITVNVDGIPPECLVDIGEPSYASAGSLVVASKTPIAIRALDPPVKDAASGVSSIEYSIGAGDPISRPDSVVVIHLSGQDGVYLLRFSATDRVDNSSRQGMLKLVLDNTPPICEINLPYDSTLVNRSISLIGTVYDHLFQSYQVEYGSGIHPLKWTKDGPPLGQVVRNSVLKHFNSSLLPGRGPFIVRITAKDLVGNTSVDSVVLHTGDVTVVDTLYLPRPLRVEALADAVYITTRAGIFRTTPELTHPKPLYNGSDMVDVAQLSGSEIAVLYDNRLAIARPPEQPEVLVDGLIMASGLAVDNHPRFYVAQDPGSVGEGKVLIYNPQGERTLTIGGLASPRDIAVDEDWAAYVVEGARHVVSKFSEQGDLMLRFGSFGCGPGKMSRPNGLAVDDRGYIWVSDTGNGRVQIFDPLGNRLYDFRLPSSGGQGMAEPLGISLLSDHSVYVADSLNLWVLRLQRPSLNEPNILGGDLTQLHLPRLVVQNLLNWPNPFNPDMQSTVFRFFLSRSSRVSMLIYDMAGRTVRSIQTECAEGLNEVVWDGCNSSGGSVPNGVYYLKFIAEGENASVVKHLKIAVLR